MSSVTVTWNKLEPYQQELVVAMFNNIQGVQDKDKDCRLSPLFHPICNVLHAVCGYNADEHPLSVWDASAEIKNGVLIVSGNEGASGYGLWHSVALPLDVKIEIGASIG